MQVSGRLLIVFSFCIALFLNDSLSVVGAEEDVSPDEVAEQLGISETVVVTSSKSERHPEEVTQSISVIDPNAPHVFYTHGNLSEALSSESGVFVGVLSRNDANWGSYGGLGSKYRTWLLDGLPIDAFVDSMAIDPWSIGRIESQHGVSSVLYPNYLSMDFAGNQSPLSGTTNLVTRTVVADEESRVLLGLGSWNTQRGKIFHAQQIDRFSIVFGGEHERSDYVDYGTDESWLRMLDDPAYQKGRLYLQTRYVSLDDNHRFQWFVHHMDHRGDAGRPNRDFDHRYDLINAGYTGNLTPTMTARVSGGFRLYDRRWGEDNYNPPQSMDLSLSAHYGVVQEIIPIDVNCAFSHHRNSLFTLGVDHQQATYETYTENDGRAVNNKAQASATGVYLQEEFLLDRWVFRGGARFNNTLHHYDLISDTKPEKTNKTWQKLLWSAGLRYNAADGLAVYANGGTSFLVPSIKSVAGTLKAEDFGVAGKNGQLPNGGLDPESGLGFDAGIVVSLYRSLEIEFRGFHSRIDEAIVENRISEDPSQSMSVNAGKTTVSGATVRLTDTIGETLSWFVTGSVTDTEVFNDVDADQHGSNVPFVPDYEGTLGVMATWGDSLSAVLSYRAIGSFYDSTSLSGRNSFGPYKVLDCRLTKTLFHDETMTTLLNVELNNVLDERYELPWQFQDPGFNFMVNLEVNW